MHAKARICNKLPSWEQKYKTKYPVWSQNACLSAPLGAKVCNNVPCWEPKRDKTCNKIPSSVSITHFLFPFSFLFATVLQLLCVLTTGSNDFLGTCKHFLWFRAGAVTTMWMNDLNTTLITGSEDRQMIFWRVQS